MHIKPLELVNDEWRADRIFFSDSRHGAMTTFGFSRSPTTPTEIVTVITRLRRLTYRRRGRLAKASARTRDGASTASEHVYVTVRVLNSVVSA